MGHSIMDMTTIYAHAVGEEQQAIAARMWSCVRMCLTSHGRRRHGTVADRRLCVWRRVAPARRDPVALPRAPRVTVGVAGAEQPRLLTRLPSPVGFDAPGHLSPGSCVPAHASYGSDQTVSIGCGPRYRDREARRPSPPVRAAPTRPCTSATPPLHAQWAPGVRQRVRSDPYHPARAHDVGDEYRLATPPPMDISGVISAQSRPTGLLTWPGPMAQRDESGPRSTPSRPKPVEPGGGNPRTSPLAQDRAGGIMYLFTGCALQSIFPGQNGRNALVFLLHHCFPLAKTVCTLSPVCIPFP